MYNFIILFNKFKLPRYLLRTIKYIFVFISEASVIDVYKIFTRKPVNRFVIYLYKISSVRTTSVHMRDVTKYNMYLSIKINNKSVIKCKLTSIL